MFFFTDELHALEAAVHSGKSAQVVAPWGVGATTLLRALGRQLENEDYAVIRVTGVPYARHVEYFGLHPVLTNPAEPPSARSFLPMLDRAVQLLRKRPLNAVILDGVEHIDRSTLAVLQAASERTGAPLVVGRSRDVRSLISTAVPFTLFGGPQFELKPLDFVSTAALIYDHLGHWPDAEVTSRTFAKSAGVTGLATAIVSGARAGGLIRLADDRWVMAADSLRNSEADSWMETHLSLLSPAEYHALEAVALEPASPLSAADPESIKTLLALGLLSGSPSPAGSIAVTQIPAMTDYFERARSNRAVSPASNAVGTYTDDGQLAPAVAAFRLSAQRRVLERARAWQAAQDIASALPYLEALFDLPRTDRAIRSVFEQTPFSTALSAPDAIDFVFLYQQWAGETKHIANIVDYDQVAAAFPDWGATVEEFSSLLSNGSPSAPSDAGAAGPRPTTDQNALLAATHAYTHLLGGDIASARAWVQRVPDSPQLVTRRLRSAVDSLALFADRDYEGSLGSGRLHIEAARCALDRNGLWLHSYTQSLSLIALGRWPEAGQIAGAALAFGPPATVDGTLYRALLYIGAFVDLTTGDTVPAERRIAEAERIDVNDERLPAMQRGLGLVLRQYIEDSPTTAMRTLRTLAEDLAASGGGFAAEMTLGVGLMTWPEVATLDQLLRVHTALGTGYPPGIIDTIQTSFTDLGSAARKARSVPDPAAAVFLARLLAARARQETESGTPPDAAVYEVVRQLELSLRLPQAAPETIRPLVDGHGHGHGHDDAAPLTAREIQIALLVRTYSNAAVAERLGVSVRTVENHVHNAMRKTGSTNRHTLYGAVASRTQHRDAP